MAVLFEAKHIVKKFNGVPALKDGNLVCRSGKITGLLGANGSGKSTINKCITGVYRKNDGTMTYLGKEVDFKNPMEAKKAGIAMAFQNLSLLPDLTVWQNVVIGFESKKGCFLDDAEAKKITKEILDDFMPGFDYTRRVSELSPAEMQIVEITKAISQNPKMLILDEPTAALEQSQVKALFSYMKRLASKGVGMIFTSHHMWEVMEMCDDVIIFKDGEVVGQLDFDKDEKDADFIIKCITGDSDKKTNSTRVYRDIPDEKVFEIKNLRYGNKIHHVSLDIKKGEVLGIGGLSGQGQDELLLAIAGNYNDVAYDEAKIGEEKAKIHSPHSAIAQGIVLVPGDRQLQGLLMNKSIYENSILPKIGLDREPFIIPKKRFVEECVEAQKLLSTKYNKIEDAVSGLSGGNAQKVVFGKWLSVDTKLLVLSNPCKGVDVGAKADMYNFVQKLADEMGIAVLVYASDNEELIDNCDRVLVMHEGAVVGELKGAQITDEALVNLSMLGGHSKKEGADNEK